MKFTSLNGDRSVAVLTLQGRNKADEVSIPLNARRRPSPVKRVFTLLLAFFLCGCATRGEVIKMDDGVIIKASRPSILKYKDTDIEVEFDSKGQSLINVPLDLDVEK